ncbi:polysaccharide deacetylase family protein [Polyangium aurulentum]|uniref:polysaccharide deacetylase family protein n=1 Tax=Polyangium aurulentum TaxID=2567896 RepID=UPI0010AE0F65|nr:polysaccharide deacetylase family protein [Polyangium aurulentum]UQA60779.1 polysaccharide deacetylase family protein [Polyangium aurulentum]
MAEARPVRSNGLAVVRVTQERLVGLAARLFAPESVFLCRVDTARPAVAITFDDGPDEETPLLLDDLARHRMRATFFVLGKQIEKFPEYTHEIVRRGHELASHGYSHRAFSLLDAGELAAEIVQTASLLPPPEGAPLLRPPRGRMSVDAMLMASRFGHLLAGWSIDTLDYKLRDPAALASRLRSMRIRPGDVLLLHEGQPWTRAMLGDLARILAERGLETAPMGELLRSAGAPVHPPVSALEEPTARMRS